MTTIPRIVSLLIVLVSACAPRSSRSAGFADPHAASCQGNPSSDTTVFDTTQVSPRPEILRGPLLEYPNRLRNHGVSGRVVLSMIINADGSLEPGSIERVRSDHPDFEKASIRYLRKAVYSPGCRAGQAVRVRVAIPIDFKIMRSR